ncbi:uncharacterized protein LOC136766356 [Amia ocellicauda]|uniref:uncharacterized protein LOC136766356 n=1 Tax=Amia ocellicauda TaxID=2972642 RepID=UPI0034648758
MSKAILEMLHINKLSVQHRTKPHPYMKLVYQLLDAQGTRGVRQGTPVWIWFPMSAAEVVLLQRATAAVHGLSTGERGGGSLAVSEEALEERLLSLDQLPPTGYDVFNVSGMLGRGAEELLGFQLRNMDKSGSLVLHDALTQSLYCLNASTHSLAVLGIPKRHPHPSPRCS